MLDPGRRKTKTGYFWALARDERPWGGAAPPGVAFTYAPGRGGKHAETILDGFKGVLQVDGYSDYARLIAPTRVGPKIRLAHCWAHARRKLVELTRAGPSPVASLIRTCKLNAVDPHAWLADTLRAIVAGHPQSRVGELLPWIYPGKV